MIIMIKYEAIPDPEVRKKLKHLEVEMSKATIHLRDLGVPEAQISKLTKLSDDISVYT